MSLTVSPHLLDQAQRGPVDDAAFTECIAASLPYAWQLISGLISELHAGDADLADNHIPPPDEAARGQLLRLMASDAMRGGVERRAQHPATRAPKRTARTPAARTAGRGGEFDEAVTAHQDAAALFRETRHRHREDPSAGPPPGAPVRRNPVCGPDRLLFVSWIGARFAW